MLPPTVTLLLVEDDPNDAFFMKTALEAVGVANPVRIIEDGRDALAYMSGGGRYSDRAEYPLPCLVLLDLKLPHVMGLEVLGWLRKRPEFASTIVIILTSSANPADIDAAYRLGANSYLVKPGSFDDLKVMARSIKDFWLMHNRLASVGSDLQD